jgi:hypothetical protein
VLLVDGHAKMAGRDGETRYEFNANVESPQAQDARLALQIVRDQGTGRDLIVEARIASRPSGRVLVARIDRADGRTTTVTAEVH